MKRSRALIAALTTAGVLTGCTNGPTHTGVDARRLCEASISARLKAPGDADFNLQVAPQGEGRWKVDGYVDAPNSFGARLREPVYCEIVVDGTTLVANAARLG